MKNRYRILLLVIAAATLSACNSSSSSGHHHDEHDARLLISETNNNVLHIFDTEGEEFSTLAGNAQGNASQLVLANDGLSAAVLADTDILSFVFSGLGEDGHGHSHDEEAEMISFSDSSVEGVIASGHFFSWLKNGNSYLLEADHLEDANSSDVVELAPAGVTQDYPALVLDKEHHMYLIFADDKAAVYEEGGSDLEATTDEFACANPVHVQQGKELILAVCDKGTQFLMIEEHDGHHHIDAGNVDFSGVSDANVTQWRIHGDDAIGFYAAGADLVKLHIDHSSHEIDAEEFVVEDSQGSSFALQGNICEADFDGHGDLIVVTDAGRVYVIDHDGELEQQITLDAPSNCADLVISINAEDILIADNTDTERRIYLIDSHDGPYHIHKRVDIPVGVEISDMVLMQERHDHDHGHGHGDH